MLAFKNRLKNITTSQYQRVKACVGSLTCIYIACNYVSLLYLNLKSCYRPVTSSGWSSWYWARDGERGQAQEASLFWTANVWGPSRFVCRWGADGQKQASSIRCGHHAHCELHWHGHGASISRRLWLSYIAPARSESSTISTPLLSLCSVFHDDREVFWDKDTVLDCSKALLKHSSDKWLLIGHCCFIYTSVHIKDACQLYYVVLSIPTLVCSITTQKLSIIEIFALIDLDFWVYTNPGADLPALCRSHKRGHSFIPVRRLQLCRGKLSLVYLFARVSFLFINFYRNSFLSSLTDIQYILKMRIFGIVCLHCVA